ncbi:MAG: alpha/beta family hydrolase [Acidobacteriota bacterium]
MTSPDELPITVRPGVTTTARVYPVDGDTVGAVLILGHGAGAGQQHPWMVECARALSALGIEIVTFNFLYSEQRRHAPDRRPLLDECYRAVIEVVRQRVTGSERSLFIGGKSMGGRIATHVAADDPGLALQGLVLLGYPLHPPGQPEKRRDAHLPAVGRPMLFVQGSRDAFGSPSELRPIFAQLVPRPALHVVDGGDHSFKIGRKDPARQAALLSKAHRAIVEWIRAAT